MANTTRPLPSIVRVTRTTTVRQPLPTSSGTPGTGGEVTRPTTGQLWPR